MTDVVITDCELGDLKDVTDDMKEENTQTDTLKKQASCQHTLPLMYSLL